MVSVSKEALDQIKEYFSEKTVQPIRIFNSPGWGGSLRLAMALDESKECDNVHTVDAFEFVVDKDLSEQLGDLFVDFKSYGFTINSEHELPGGTKDCSGCSCGK